MEMKIFLSHVKIRFTLQLVQLSCCKIVQFGLLESTTKYHISLYVLLPYESILTALQYQVQLLIDHSTFHVEYTSQLLVILLQFSSPQISKTYEIHHIHVSIDSVHSKLIELLYNISQSHGNTKYTAVGQTLS